MWAGAVVEVEVDSVALVLVVCFGGREGEGRQPIADRSC